LRDFWISCWGSISQENRSGVSPDIDVIAEKYGLSAEILESQLKLPPLHIYQRTSYEDFLDKASKRLAESDADDVELLALSLKLKVPVWSNDRHFQRSGVEVYTTAKLLKILKA